MWISYLSSVFQKQYFHFIQRTLYKNRVSFAQRAGTKKTTSLQFEKQRQKRMNSGSEFSRDQRTHNVGSHARYAMKNNYCLTLFTAFWNSYPDLYFFIRATWKQLIPFLFIPYEIHWTNIITLTSPDPMIHLVSLKSDLFTRLKVYPLWTRIGYLYGIIFFLSKQILFVTIEKQQRTINFNSN